MVYTSVEQYTEAGRMTRVKNTVLSLKPENRDSTGAAKMPPYWKLLRFLPSAEDKREKRKDERYINSCSKHLVRFLGRAKFLRR